MAADMEALYRAAVGEKKADYYVPRFLATDAGEGGRFGWHWPAFFVTLPWLLWRRMWAMAGLYIVLPSVVFFALQMVAAAVAASGGETGGYIAAGIGFVAVIAAMWVVPPMVATRLYHMHIKERIQELQRKRKRQRADVGQDAMEDALRQQPHVSKLAIALYLLLYVGVFLLGMLAAIALPAYQDYTVRAQTSTAYTVARLPLYEVLGEKAESLDWGQWDGKRVPAGSTEGQTSVSGTLGYDEEYGVVEFTFDGGHSSLVGERLWFEPELDDNGNINGWKCSSPNIVDKKLPVGCRSED